MPEDFEILKHAIKQRLSEPLPGHHAHIRMMPSIRHFSTKKKFSSIRLSAVMILLYPHDDILHIAFFKRAETDGPHAGQIALPGGKKDKQDATLLETALRETEEEFGINRNEIDILGALTKIFIPVSNSDVHPYVGFIDHKPDFKPNASEVEYIIETPLNELFKPENKVTLTKHRHGLTIITPLYKFHHEEIWGATAMITSEFEEIYQQI